MVRLGFFPHLTRLVHECLRHTVKQARPVPVARVNCEKSEPKVRGGNPGTISDSTKDAQPILEFGASTFAVALFTQHLAQVDDRLIVVYVPDRMTDSNRLFKVCPRSRDVSHLQRVDTSIVLHMCDAVLIAGPFGARDGFGEQLFAAGWIDDLAAEEVHPQAVGQQDLVAEQPGALDSLFPEWKPSLRVAAEVTLSAKMTKRPDE